MRPSAALRARACSLASARGDSGRLGSRSAGRTLCGVRQSWRAALTLLPCWPVGPPRDACSFGARPIRRRSASSGSRARPRRSSFVGEEARGPALSGLSRLGATGLAPGAVTRLRGGDRGGELEGAARFCPKVDSCLSCSFRTRRWRTRWCFSVPGEPTMCRRKMMGFSDPSVQRFSWTMATPYTEQDARSFFSDRERATPRRGAELRISRAGMPRAGPRRRLAV